MAKEKHEDPPAGSPAWMATFSDLMNLLLCFFVLLFSMSTTDQEKFEEVIASLQSSFSIFSGGSVGVGKGQMISSGVSQLEMFDSYFNSARDGQDENYEKEGSSDTDSSTSANGVLDASSAKEIVEEAGASENEKIAEEVEKQLASYGLQDQVEVDFNANYVLITINGALLFDSGSAELSEDALDIVGKLAKILENYPDNIIEVEGHTDNVPMASKRYENNDVLSMYRALNVANYIRESSDISPAHIKSAGRGEYVPIADNSTAEGRARNRRVEIKIYNSFESESQLADEDGASTDEASDTSISDDTSTDTSSDNVTSDEAVSDDSTAGDRVDTSTP